MGAFPQAVQSAAEYPESSDSQTVDLITSLIEEAEVVAGERITQRVLNRMVEKRERELLPAQLPSTEQQALAMIKAVGQQLQHAGQELFAAAAQLKSAGRGVHANRAFLAGKAAYRQAASLVGDDAPED